ncbi:MAG: hypothetical protein RL375_582, partial [Pseudomonadota bacterium]
MSQIQSQIQTRSPEFQANATAMRALVDDLRRQAQRAGEGGG